MLSLNTINYTMIEQCILNFIGKNKLGKYKFIVKMSKKKMNIL